MWRKNGVSCVAVCRVVSRRWASQYNPAAVEEKWSSTVRRASTPTSFPGGQTPKSSSGAKPFYTLSMFPYPSGSLHMGHVRVYTISDALARFHRFQGRQVIHPMGWDAFGLPAENAAIERGVEPVVWTSSNIRSMRDQLDMLGLCFDWDRAVTTCDPAYYKWTQWLFQQMYAHGLAYRKEAEVNWDPVDQTVLANEQVDAEGRSWRSGAKVEKRMLKQWFLGITQYAERLHDGLKALNWPSHVLDMQRTWIGRSEGFVFNLDVIGGSTSVKAFTTRPDTIFGATFVGVSPNHPILDAVLTGYQDEVNHLRTTVSRQSAKFGEKKDCDGAETGVFVAHPFTGLPIPVYATSYVLDGYGTGAVLGVPAHDERDFRFAKRFGLPVVRVVTSPGQDATTDIHEAETGQEGILTASAEFSGLSVLEGASAICDAAEKNDFGTRQINYRVRDWLVSRQRYWGAPIPMVECDECGDVPTELPVTLPHTSGLQLVGADGGSPLSSVADWVNTSCPQCGNPAKRCTDTMDTFVDSSWYYARYLDATNEKELCSAPSSQGLPVDLYIGGIEHAVLHLLYARFISYFLHDIGVVPSEEPFAKLLTQGMVHGRTLASSVTGQWLKPEDVVASEEKGGVEREIATGKPVEVFWAKMSKSKYNGVDPTAIVQKYGADTARVFTLFKAPPQAVLSWDDDAIQGVHRWLQRVWTLVNKHAETTRAGCGVDVQSARDEQKDAALARATHLTIQSVTKAYNDTHSFNTAVSDLMKLSNTLKDCPSGNPSATHAVRSLLILLSPAAPHIAAELWETIADLPACVPEWDPSRPIFEQVWPLADPSKLQSDMVELPVQIGRKFRGTVSVPMDVLHGDELALRQFVLNSSVGRTWVANETLIAKVILPKTKKMIGFLLKPD